MLGCDLKKDSPTPSEKVIRETEVHTSLTNSNQQLTVSLSMLDATTPDNVWEQFFVEHGAIECWEILQEREEPFYFDFMGLTKPAVGINLLDRANQLAEAIIKYLTCHFDSILPKELTFTTSEADKSKILTYIPVQIGELSSLEELSLTGHDIQELPAEIGHLTYLRVLDVSCNQLRSLPAQLNNLLNLRKLLLYGNELRKLPAVLYTKIDRLNKRSLVKLDDNEWNNYERLAPFDNEPLQEILEDIISQIFPRSLVALCIKSIENYLQEYPNQTQYIETNLPAEFCQARRKQMLDKLKKEAVLNIDNLVFFKIIDNEHIPFYLYYPLHTYQDIKAILRNLEGVQIYMLLPPSSDDSINNQS
jgi:hypothetical protein